MTKVSVTSRSFSRNPVLRNQLLEKYSNVNFNDEGIKLVGEELYEFLKDSDKAIIALENITEELLTRLPKLKTISKYGVGLDSLDLKAMESKGIKLGWTSGANKRSVAELTLTFALGMIRKTFEASDLVKNDVWKQVVGEQLTGKTFGIIGLGNVGKDLVQLLKPFNCKILSHDIVPYDDFSRENNIKQTSLENVLAESDIVSIHIPYSDKTDKFIAQRELKLMKENAIIINTARGGIVCEESLLKSLESGEIAGAAFDVLAQEPPSNWPLIKHPKFFITPHIGGSAAEAIINMGQAAIEGLDNHINYSEL